MRRPTSGSSSGPFPAEDKLPEDSLGGDIEEFPAGESCNGTFTLDPGAYVLLCNLTEREGTKTVAHLAKGMAVPFQVTG